jgi:hypothetical protein
MPNRDMQHPAYCSDVEEIEKCLLENGFRQQVGAETIGLCAHDMIFALGKRYIRTVAVGKELPARPNIPKMPELAIENAPRFGGHITFSIPPTGDFHINNTIHFNIPSVQHTPRGVRARPTVQLTTHPNLNPNPPQNRKERRTANRGKKPVNPGQKAEWREQRRRR